MKNKTFINNKIFDILLFDLFFLSLNLLKTEISKMYIFNLDLIKTLIKIIKLF